MTIATTRTQEFTVGQAVTLAMRIAGLKGPQEVPSAQEMLLGQDLLSLLIKGPVFAQAVTRGLAYRTLTLTGDTLDYPLEDGDIDVFGDGAFTPTGETASRPVRQIDGGRWNQLPPEDETDEPTFFFADRSASPVVLKLWPGAADGTLRIRVHQQRADVTDTTTTLDVEPHWQDSLVKALAADLSLASNLPQSRTDGLSARAGGSAVMARGISGENVPQKIEFSHRHGWRA